MPGSQSSRIAWLLCLVALAVMVQAAPGLASAAKSKAAAQEQEDDWQFEADYAKVHKLKDASGSPGASAMPSARGGPMPAAAPAKALRAPGQGRLGMATGGAKDIANFRENCAKGFLPMPSDVTYEGVFYDYTFDVGGTCENNQLFCPSYATAVSRDPLGGQTEYYLSVGLGSNLDAASFRRKKLNLMIVLDISGSMSSPFDSYYYDRFGNKHEAAAKDADRGKSKLEVAADALLALLDQLGPDDRFGLVLFDQFAYTALTLRPVAGRNMEAIKGHIRNLRAMGGTNLDAGLSLASERMQPARESPPQRYENRIVFMTDAMPNLGDTSDKAFLARITENAKARLYATVIGIGLDFNTELTEKITKARGANSYSIHSPGEFRQRLGQEFDYMVTPVVFDLTLDFQSQGYAIEAVYGSPEADAATGTLMRVNTLFPSPTSEDASRGGIILLRLKKKAEAGEILLSASYEDRTGQRQHTSQRLTFAPREAGYDTPSIRKGILLARYVGLLKDWITAARGQEPAPRKSPPARSGEPATTPELGQWERQSQPLRLTAAQRAKFEAFRRYFQSEMAQCNDKSLDRELAVLNGLLGQAR